MDFCDIINDIFPGYFSGKFINALPQHNNNGLHISWRTAYQGD